jgi:hypothetical protein
MKVYLLADIRDQINEQMFVPIVTAAADCCKNQVNFTNIWGFWPE